MADICEFFELLRDAAPELHYRKCWHCESVALHVERYGDWVKCRKCGSMDTRAKHGAWDKPMQTTQEPRG